MPIELADVVKKGSKRLFLQAGGPGPQNALAYYGVDTQYINLVSGARPLLGSVDPVVIADPFKADSFVIVGQMVKPVSKFPSAKIEVTEKLGTLPFPFGDLGCPYNVYVVNSVCKDPSAFDNGWAGYMEVWGSGTVISADLGDRTALTSDEPVKDEVELAFRRLYAVGGMQLSSKGGAAVVREITDVCIAPNRLCANCGVANNGFKWQYALHAANSGVTAAAVLYSTDSGVTWTSLAITAIVNTEQPVAIFTVGKYLVVASPTGQSATQSAYYYSVINQTTGVPSATWTKVATGFDTVGGHLVLDAIVLSEREVFFVGNAGYIYKSTDITAGVTLIDAAGVSAVAYNRIDNRGDVIVIHGASGKVVYSLNRGLTFSLTVTDPYANPGSAVCVVSPTFWWVGSTSGDFSYTLDGGNSWTVANTKFGLTVAGVQDIQAPSPDTLFVAYTIAGPLAHIAASNNGGRTFIDAADATNARLLNMPSGANQRVNRIACPVSGDFSTAVNNFVAAGLGLTTVGLIVLAAANFQ